MSSDGTRSSAAVRPPPGRSRALTVALGVTLAATLSAVAYVENARASSGKPEQRLVSLGVTRAPSVPDDIQRTIDDTFRSQLSQAAQERGFEELPLTRIRGLEEEAASCKSQQCRLSVTARLRATHAIRGHLERRGRGYQLTLFLEDGANGAFLGGKRMSGDLPLLISELRDNVDALLEESSPKRAAAMERLAKTARAYLEKGREDDAMRTLERAIDVSPFHPDGAALQLERVALIERTGNDEASFKAVLEVLELYGPRSLWTLAGIGQGGAQERMHLWLRQKLAAIGTNNQRAARLLDEKATKDEAAEVERARLLERAEKAYGIYLEEFADAADAPELTLYLAELEYGRGAYVDAAAHYAVVASSEGASQDHKRQATSSAVYALEKELSAAVSRGDVSKLDLTAALAPIAEAGGVAPEERAFISAIDLLTTTFPDAPDASAFAYRAAQICVFRGELDEGKRRLADVAKAWPRSPAGKLAAAASQKL